MGRGHPLGQRDVVALVWQKGDNLRISLDRADLWDLRPMDNMGKPEFSFKWVQEQVKNKNYKVVHEMFDVPYDRLPAPSKIQGAALEFDTKELGKVLSVRLLINNALCETKWANGASLQTFVSADQPSGWFRFEGVPENFVPVLMPPQYQKEEVSGIINQVTG